MKIPFIAIIRYTKVSVLVLMLLIFIFIFWFLYKQFYQPLTQAVAVAELKAKVALVTINRQELENVLATIESSRKIPDINWPQLRDIFALTNSSPATPATPASGTPTKKP